MNKSDYLCVHVFGAVFGAVHCEVEIANLKPSGTCCPNYYTCIQFTKFLYFTQFCVKKVAAMGQLDLIDRKWRLLFAGCQRIFMLDKHTVLVGVEGRLQQNIQYSDVSIWQTFN